MSREENGYQYVHINDVFTLAMTTNLLAPLLLAGPLLDGFGPRACSCVSSCIIGLGFLLFGVSAELPGGSYAYLLPAMILIGMGGPGCQCSLFHTANLFQARGMALNFITAFIGPSFVIFELLVELSSRFSIPLQRAFLFYSILPFACTMVSAIIMSDLPYESVKLDKDEFSKSSLDGFASNLAAFDTDVALTVVADTRPKPKCQTASARLISLGAARPMVFIRRKKIKTKGLRRPQEAHSPRSTKSSKSPVPQRRSEPRSPGFLEPLLPTPANSPPDSPAQPGPSVRDRFPAIFRQSKDTSERDPQSGKQTTDVDLIEASFPKQVTSIAFAELTLLFATCNFFCNAFLANMHEEAEEALLRSMQPSDASRLAAAYVATYFKLSPIGGLLNPLLGYCIDRSGFLPILVLLLSVGALNALAMWLGYFFVSAAVFSVFSTCMFSYTYSYLAFEFGFEYYGLLAGIVQSVAALSMLTLEPRFHAAALRYGWSSLELLQVTVFVALGFLLLGRRLWRHLLEANAMSASSLQHDCKDSRDITERSYSDGDMHTLPVDTVCRRRADLFPVVDDILVVDGAYPHVSTNAYQMENSPLKEERKHRGESIRAHAPPLPMSLKLDVQV